MEHLFVLELEDYLSYSVDFPELLLPYTSDACYEDQIRMYDCIFVYWYQHFKFYSPIL